MRETPYFDRERPLYLGILANVAKSLTIPLTFLTLDIHRDIPGHCPDNDTNFLLGIQRNESEPLSKSLKFQIICQYQNLNNSPINWAEFFAFKVVL